MNEQPRVTDASVVLLRTGTLQDREWSGHRGPTGADKQPREGAVHLGLLGFEGDEQGDTKHHGGRDKAVCCQAIERIREWHADGHDLPVGAFFENLTLRGATEDLVFLGDVFRVGSATVQVTQPRRPCTTVSRRWQNKDLPRLMQETGRCGFYLRVLEEGRVSPGDPFEFVSRPEGAVSVAEVNRVMNVDRHDEAGIRALLDAPELPAKWREQLERRLSGVTAPQDDDAARLGTGTES